MATQKKVKTPGLTGAFDLFPKSYEAVRRNLQLFLLLFLLPIVGALFNFRTSTTTTKTNSYSSVWSSISGAPTFAVASVVGIGLLITIALLIAFVMIRAMLYALQLEAGRGKTPTLSELWEIGKKYWLRLFGLSIIVGIVVIVGIIAFIVPGLIFLRRYYLAPYVMIDQDVDVFEAMRRSAALTKPHSRSIWNIIGVTFLLELPGVIPFVGSFIAVILTGIYSVAPAIRYDELKKLAA